MAIRKIRLENDDILRKKSKEVIEYSNKIKELIEDMFETMEVNDGAGLAAVQVGILKRIIVINVDNTKLALINPVIIKQDGRQVCEEGCLSLPNKFYNVQRPKNVVVQALDQDFNPVTINGKDILAVVLCHEIDHLDGVLFIDKIYKGDK